MSGRVSTALTVALLVPFLSPSVAPFTTPEASDSVFTMTITRGPAVEREASASADRGETGTLG